jgi:hypothetical protein
MRRLELSCLIGMAANPTLRVMTIDEGDQLDDAAIARLQEIATANDYQVWLTGIRVPGQTTDTLFVADLADGHVAGNTTPPSETPETPTPTKPRRPPPWRPPTTSTCNQSQGGPTNVNY